MKNTGKTTAAFGLMLLAAFIILMGKFSVQDAHAAIPSGDQKSIAPASECDICSLYFPSIDLTCQPDGSIHWVATVRNNNDCTVNTGYFAQLLVQRNYGEYEVVLVDHYPSMAFPPGDTTFSGNFTYNFPPDATGMEVIIRFDTSGADCGFREGKSGVFDPCQPGDGTPRPHTYTPTPTRTNTPPRHATNTPTLIRTNTPTRTSTVIPATRSRTPEPTDTPTGEPEATDTPTNTPVPPTNTRTRTPTRTNTAVPATRTATPRNNRHRMTGGGHIEDGGKTRDTSHGFQLRCDATDHRQSLEVNWEGGNKWHLEDLTSATCIDDPALNECPPCAGFDTYIGTGVGRYNGDSGATAEWTFTDDGEPGTNDHFDMVIRDSGGNIVLDVSGFLDGGNHQAHK